MLLLCATPALALDIIAGVWRRRRDGDRRRRNHVRESGRGYFAVSARDRHCVDHRVLQGRQDAGALFLSELF